MFNWWFERCDLLLPWGLRLVYGRCSSWVVSFVESAGLLNKFFFFYRAEFVLWNFTAPSLPRCCCELQVCFLELFTEVIMIFISLWAYLLVYAVGLTMSGSWVLHGIESVYPYDFMQFYSSKSESLVCVVPLRCTAFTEVFPSKWHIHSDLGSLLLKVSQYPFVSSTMASNVLKFSFPSLCGSRAFSLLLEMISMAVSRIAYLEIHVFHLTPVVVSFLRAINLLKWVSRDFLFVSFCLSPHHQVFCLKKKQRSS